LHTTQLTDRITNMARKLFSEEIRDAIRRCRRTNYDLAREMNVAPSTLWRFTQGQCGISTEKLDKLAEVLDLHVVTGSTRKAK
jgi:transcriptional regulator with XRE-family HTH domain